MAAVVAAVVFHVGVSGFRSEIEFAAVNASYERAPFGRRENQNGLFAILGVADTNTVIRCKGNLDAVVSATTESGFPPGHKLLRQNQIPLLVQVFRVAIPPPARRGSRGCPQAVVRHLAGVSRG